MSIRLYKLVVPFEEVADFADYSVKSIQPGMQDYVLPDGMRFYQSSNSTSTFFLSVWWKTEESAALFDSSEIGKSLTQGVQKYLAQRMVHWDMDTVAGCEEKCIPIDYSVTAFMRLVKIRVNGISTEDAIIAFKEYADNIISKQSGNITVKLLKCSSAPDLYFAYAIWASKQDFKNFTKQKSYRDIVSESHDFLEERMEIWSLNILGSLKDVFMIGPHSVRKEVS